MPEYVQLTVTGKDLPVILADPVVERRDGRDVVTGRLVNERGVTIQTSCFVARRKIRRQHRAVMHDGVLVPV